MLVFDKTSNYTYTIDFNGHVLKCGGLLSEASSRFTLILNDANNEGGIDATVYNAIHLTGMNNLTINGGIYKGAIAVYVDKINFLTINNGIFIGTTYSVYVSHMKLEEGITVTVNDGYFNYSEGTYVNENAEALHVNDTNISIKGGYYASNSNVIAIDSSSSCNIKAITVIGGSNYAVTVPDGSVIEDSALSGNYTVVKANNLTIKNSIIKAKQTGLELKGEFIVDNCQIESEESSAIIVTDATSGQITSSTIKSKNNGISINNSSNITINSTVEAVQNAIYSYHSELTISGGSYIVDIADANLFSSALYADYIDSLVITGGEFKVVESASKGKNQPAYAIRFGNVVGQNKVKISACNLINDVRGAAISFPNSANNDSILKEKNGNIYYVIYDNLNDDYIYLDSNTLNLGSYTIKEIEHTDHIIGIIAGYPATCTTSGLSDEKYCKICLEIIEQAHTINGEHDIVHHDAVAPTTKTKGNYAYDTCTKCNYTTYRSIQKLVPSGAVSTSLDNDGTLGDSVVVNKLDVTITEDLKNRVKSYLGEKEAIANAFDIYITKDAKQVQLSDVTNQNIVITIFCQGFNLNDLVKILHYHSDTEIEVINIENCTINNNELSFSVNKLSKFILVKNNESSSSTPSAGDGGSSATPSSSAGASTATTTSQNSSTSTSSSTSVSTPSSKVEPTNSSSSQDSATSTVVTTGVDSQASGGLSGGAIAGIVIGSIALAALAAFAIIFILIKKGIIKK